MSKIIVFEGNNEDEFFVEANKIIYNIERGEEIEDWESNYVKIRCFNSTVGNGLNSKEILSYIQHEGIVNYVQLNRIIEKEKTKDFYYLLHIKQEKNQGEVQEVYAYDVIPLRLFTILRREYKKKIYLCIDLMDGDIANASRIAGYMLIDNLSEMNIWKSEWIVDKKKKESKLHIQSESLNNNLLYNQVYINGGGLKRLQIHNMGSLNKILPCIYLDWEWQKLFSSSVETYYKDFVMEEAEVRDGLPIKKDYIYKVQKGLGSFENETTPFRKAYKNYVSAKEWKNIFYSIIIRDICLDNLKDSRILRRENQKEIFSFCKNMSILSLLLFSAFCHFIYDTTKEDLEKSQINNLCQSAQDFAEGLLQLIENALDYAKGGCFSFRIHKGDSTYFKKQYKGVDINSELYYLEVLISDLNYNESIPEKFINNLQRRCINGELPYDLKEKIACKITLQGFFEPDKAMEELWNKYYMIAENVTNHYGLQLFDSLVNYYHGYFSVSSGDNGEKARSYSVNYGLKRKNKKQILIKSGLPGTQYSILLPIKKQEEQKRIGIDMYPAFDDVALKQKWENKPININDLLSGIKKEDFNNHREVKKQNINIITNNCERLFEEDKVFVIDLHSASCTGNVELIAKAMITFILHHQKKELRIALIKANYEFIIAFTRFFAIFYNKKAKCTAMKNTQLFLCDEKNKVEINFAGESLETAYAGNELWANAKGEYNQCLEILQIILRQRTSNSSRRGKKYSAAPFELLIHDKNGKTLFEHRVYNDLVKNIQKEEFGCLLNNVHMRVGAKMHVTDHFFETFQLFNSTLYNSRFAFLLAAKIKMELDKLKRKEKKDLVIVGYDIYSELLILETQKILKQIYKISVRCLIYEQLPHPKFRMWKEDMKNSKFVIVVPTSTTLTTHGKIAVELENKMQDDISSKILFNVALILIRDSSEKVADGVLADGRILVKNLTDIEKNYWYAIQTDIRSVRTKTTCPENITYNVLVASKWQEPMKCKSCYPSVLTEEKPIIEVNRASVVPMIMAGPMESSLKIEENNFERSQNLDILKDVMIYGHIKRKNNHFQYYFKTDELMQQILETEKNKEEYQGWLQTVKGKVLNQKEEMEQKVGKNFDQIPHIYNILVAPIHETNASFLESINDFVFEGVPMVLYIDSDREYRENIQSKYSNLTALYNNILNTGRKALINFHYVDDTINSGVAFRRTYSLLKCLFPVNAFKKDAQVKVNLFQNILLLINRNSNSTVASFPYNGDFFAFFNLHISGLRNHHENACALCSEVSDYEKIKVRSVINKMASYWESVIDNKKVKDIAETKFDEVKQEIYFRRLICTHEINQILGEMGWDRNNTLIVKQELTPVLSKRLKDEKLTYDLKMEYVMAYFTVLSRPYLSYRKSMLDVTFPLLLEVMERILNASESWKGGQKETLEEYICEEIFLKASRKIKKDFLLMLIESISRVGACYLIRAEVVNKLFKLAKELEFDMNEFELYYGAAVKRLITLGKDESIGLWLEYLILLEKEYEADNDIRLKVSQSFKDFLFYENTYIIADAVDELVYKGIGSKEEVDPEEEKKKIDKYFDKYYFDNFKKLMCFDLGDGLKDGLSEDNKSYIKEVLWGMVRLKRHLEKKDNSQETNNYYTSLIEIIQGITSAEYLCIYGIDSSDQIYVIGSSIDDYYSTSFFRNIEHNRKNATKNNDYLNNSVYFYKEDTVLMCIMEKGDGEKNNSDAVWIMLQFKKEKNSDTQNSDMQKADRHKFAVRNVLVYKYLLSMRLKNDFRKNTFSRIKELSIKNELLSNPKTGTHTPDKVLERIEYQLENIGKEEVHNENTLKWAGALLQMAADSLISKLYVEGVVAEGSFHVKGGVKGIDQCLSFEEFSFTDVIQRLLMQMEFLNKNEIKPTSAIIEVDKCAEQFPFKFPSESRFYNLFIIAAIVQNAVKHGQVEDDKSNKVKVCFTLRGEYLIIKNKLKKGAKVKEDDDKESAGITIPALKHYFETYYGAKMCAKTDEEKSMYEVGIPVVFNKNEVNDER